MGPQETSTGTSAGRSRRLGVVSAPGRMVLLYLLLATLWIFLSDRMVEWLAVSGTQESYLQTSKGLAFVFATAALLYLLLRRSFKNQERALAELRDLSERFELVARASNDAIWDWNLITNEIWWSEGFQNLFGYAKEELEPTIDSWTKRLHPEDKDRTVSGIYRVISGGGCLWTDEYRFRCKDGRYAHVHDRGFVVHDARGKPVRMVGGMMDITERKVVAEQLDRSRRQMRALSARLESLREEDRTRMAREIHDELGQLLTGLQMDLRWAEKKLAAMEGRPELNPILDKLVGASELTDQTIVRVQQIAADLRPGVLDNFGLATAIKYEAKRFQERAGLPCALDLPESELELNADVAIGVFRILQEALTNVARHAGATEVAIALRQEEDQLVLRVRDNGRGINAEQLGNPRSLGLVGMKERASLLGAEITFARADGAGTVVTLRIPKSAHDTKFWEIV